MRAAALVAALGLARGGLTPADIMGRTGNRAARGADPANPGTGRGQFTIADIEWGGELAAPWEFPEARMEQKVRSLPHERETEFSAARDPLGLRDAAAARADGDDAMADDEQHSLEELARRQRRLRAQSDEWWHRGSGSGSGGGDDDGGDDGDDGDDARGAPLSLIHI